MSPLIDATGTRRRLEALAALGHPASVIGARMGLPAGSARALICTWKHRERRLIHSRTARRVASVYDELKDQPGTNAVVRIHALRGGCLPPAAWDGVAIDDPGAEPGTEDEERRVA